MNLSAYELSLHVITVLTIFLQIYVFFLIIKMAPRSMAEYKFYLCYFTFWDLAFTVILGVFVQPSPIGRSVSVRVLGLASYIGPTAQLISICALIYSCFNVLLSQVFCLMYRYTAIHENKMFKNLFVSKRSKIVCTLVAQVAATAISCLAYQVFVPPEKYSTSNFIGPLENLKEVVKPDEFVVLVYEASRVPKLFASIVSSFFLSSELFCCFLVWSILSTLKKKAHSFSKNTYKLHFQLTLLLTIQLMLPLVLIILPVSVRWARALLEYEDSSTLNHIRIAIILTYSFVNSVFTILFVAPFRAHTFNLFIYTWLRPICVVLGLERIAPVRRKSTAWMTTTRHGVQPVTVRSSFGGSD